MAPVSAELAVLPAAPVELDVPAPAILICLEGAGNIDGEPYHAGEAWHVSNATVRVEPGEPSRWLLTHVPPRYS